MDARVEVIRASKLVGRNTCSTVAECYSDEELTKALDDEVIATPEAAVAWAIEMEDLQMEQATEQRWGEDSDPQLKMVKEWEERKKAAGHEK